MTVRPFKEIPEIIGLSRIAILIWPNIIYQGRLRHVEKMADCVNNGDLNWRGGGQLIILLD